MKYIVSFMMALWLLGSSNSAQAQTISINASSYPYNALPAVTNANVRSIADIRIAALSGAAGAFRTETGGFASPLKPGVKFKLTYVDGSSEQGEMVNYSSAVGVVPVPNTQKDANGNPIAATGAGGSGSMPIGGVPGAGIGITIVGYDPIYDYTSVCDLSGCVLKLVIIGYRPIFERTLLEP